MDALHFLRDGGLLSANDALCPATSRGDAQSGLASATSQYRLVGYARVGPSLTASASSPPLPLPLLCSMRPVREDAQHQHLRIGERRLGFPAGVDAILCRASADPVYCVLSRTGPSRQGAPLPPSAIEAFVPVSRSPDMRRACARLSRCSKPPESGRLVGVWVHLWTWSG